MKEITPSPRSASGALKNADRSLFRPDSDSRLQKFRNVTALVLALAGASLGMSRGVRAQKSELDLTHTEQNSIMWFSPEDEAVIPAYDVNGNIISRQRSVKHESSTDSTEKFLPDPQYVERQPVNAETQKLLDEIKALTGGKTEVFEPLNKAELWEGDTTDPKDYVHLDDCQDLLRLYIEGIKTMPDMKKSYYTDKNLYPDYIVWRSTTYMGTGGTNGYTVVESYGKQRVINVLRLTSQKYSLDRQLKDLPYSHKTMADVQMWMLMHELGHGYYINDDPVFWNYHTLLWNTITEIKNKANLLRTCQSGSRIRSPECQADFLAFAAQDPDNFITIASESSENAYVLLDEPGLKKWTKDRIESNPEVSKFIENLRTNRVILTSTPPPSTTPQPIATGVPSRTPTSDSFQIFLPNLKKFDSDPVTGASSTQGKAEVAPVLEPGSVHAVGQMVFVMLPRAI